MASTDEFEERLRNNPRREDPRSTEELLQIALTEEDEDRYWDAVSALHFRPTPQAFETAHRLCESTDPGEREVGADILGQLGIPERMHPDEAVAILVRLLETDEDVDVLSSAATALGHQRSPRAIPALVRHKTHPDPDVRYAVVFGLLALEDEDAISALIELSEDEDDDVRDWATFGLGSMIETDTPAIRETLWRRANDPVGDVRGEAIVGLAVRHDTRALGLLLRELQALEAEGHRPGLLLTEAAKALADPSLCPALLALQQQPESSEEQWDYGLADAIAACCGEMSEADDT